MPTLEDRTPLNVPGPFYVDSSCIDCDACRGHVPQFFTRSDEEGRTYVQRQPVTDDEFALAREALELCPTESIGCDGA